MGDDVAGGELLQGDAGCRPDIERIDLHQAQGVTSSLLRGLRALQLPCREAPKVKLELVELVQTRIATVLGEL